MSKADNAIRNLALNPEAIQVDPRSQRIVKKVLEAFAGVGDGAWSWASSAAHSGPPGGPRVMSAPAANQPDMIVLVVPATYPEVD